MVGIDITSVGRFRRLVMRYPMLEERFFTEAERSHCRSHVDPIIHLAGTFAAKEAVVKAMGLGPVRAWARRIEIIRADDGAPRARIIGSGLGDEITVSISHDGDAAVAVAIRTPAERGSATTVAAGVARGEGVATAAGRPAHGSHTRSRGGAGPNGNVQRFLGIPRRNGTAPVLTAFSDCGCGSDFP